MKGKLSAFNFAKNLILIGRSSGCCKILTSVGTPLVASTAKTKFVHSDWWESSGVCIHPLWKKKVNQGIQWKCWFGVRLARLG